mmetsp:Transcript_113246/g.320532  ORF Transcript_113246/g.320532 Transcript_113246/m.320532 type:complete len:174 (+) Transcript_113246:93-614(+)
MVLRQPNRLGRRASLVLPALALVVACALTHMHKPSAFALPRVAWSSTGLRARSGLAPRHSSLPAWRRLGELGLRFHSPLPRGYWDSRGPKPDQTTEGSVIPGLILAVGIAGFVFYPLVFGLSATNLLICAVGCLITVALNVAALAANKNLPTYIDEVIGAKKNGDGKGKRWPW